MARVVRGDVLELPYARLQAFVAVVLHTGIQCQTLVLQDEKDVWAEDDRPAREVS